MAKKTQDGGLAEAEDSGMTRVGRVKHETLGECVRVRLRHWAGSLYAGTKGRHEFTEHLFPRDQGRWGAPPLAIGYNDAGQRTITVSSSVSYIDELRRYGNFRWARPAATDSQT